MYTLFQGCPGLPLGIDNSPKISLPFSFSASLSTEGMLQLPFQQTPVYKRCFQVENVNLLFCLLLNTPIN